MPANYPVREPMDTGTAQPAPASRIISPLPRRDPPPAGLPLLAWFGSVIPMNHITIRLALLTATLAATPLAAQRAVLDPDVVRARIEARIATVPGAEVAVTIVNLGIGSQLAINGDRVYHAASTMKVPVLIDLLREADAGRITLDQPVLLVNVFHSIVDGSPYALDPADDSDDAVYARVGERVPIRWLAERMINHSSNLATNALIALLDPVRITATMRTLGAERTLVLRGVEDGPAYRAGRNNVTTADDLAAILKAIERREAASPAATEFLLSVLRAQAFNAQIPAGLPPGIPVAHKTGQITATLHDAAIIYPPGRAPFVLVVLTRGIPEHRTA
jgi:beta-lactamase class A